MSGHSKWSTIKRKKGVADAKRGAIFGSRANMPNTMVTTMIAMTAPRAGPVMAYD